MLKGRMTLEGARRRTNELRLRRAERGSGEHRRDHCRVWRRWQIASKRAASSGREDAPASQLLNVDMEGPVKVVEKPR